MMKRFSLLLILLIASCVMSAQNYIRTSRMLNDTGSSYLDNFDYYDGLGRSFLNSQWATKDGVRPGKSIITFEEYDNLGRKSCTRRSGCSSSAASKHQNL